MAVGRDCPDEKTLEALAFGRIEPADVERLAQHCERCLLCIQALERITCDDSLESTIRTVASTTVEPLSPVLNSLISHLRSAYPSLDTLGTSRAAADSYDFLAPAQAPDELGRFGAYRILQVLGSGGMGTVFLAEEPELKRRVALKVMKPALAASTSARQRFLREGQAMAAVQHDHIIHVNLIGQTGELPYLEMPYVPGETLDDRLERDGPLPLTDVVRIGREIAEGLAAAHEQGLIHRDVKPPNVWLERARGRVKILDFGLVRAIADEQRLTQQGAIAGTPAYMSPEQAQGKGGDHLSDLFSLGCVLYHMCTGRAPFEGENPLQILRSVESDQPPAPQTRRKELPPMLSRLILRLMAKRPEDRPDSLRVVIDELREIDAALAMPSWETSSRKHVRNSRFILLLVLCSLSVLVAPTVVRLLTAKGELFIESNSADIEVTIRGERAIVYDKARERRYALSAGKYEVEVRDAADKDLRVAAKSLTIYSGKREVFHARFVPVQRPTITSGPSESETLPVPASPLDALNRHDIPAPERFDWQPQELVAVFGRHEATHWGIVHAIAVSPNGTMLASGGADGIHLSDAKTQFIGTLDGHDGAVRSLAFAGRSQLLSAGEDGTLRLWDIASKREILKLTGHAGRVLAVAVTTDGTRALSGGDDATIRLWNLATAKEIRRFDKSRTAVWKIVLSADDRRVLSGGDDQTMRFWDLETGEDLVQFDVEKPGTFEFHAIALSPDGSRAFSGTTEGNDLFSSMRIWDTSTGKEVRRSDSNHSVTHNGHGVEITRPGAVTCGPNGMVLTGVHAPADGNQLILWDIQSGDVLKRFGQQATATTSVAFSPDGKRVYSGTRLGRLKGWDLATGEELAPVAGHESFIASVSLSADGHMLLTGGEDLSVRLWKVSPPQRQLQVYQAAHPETAYSSPWQAEFTTAGAQALFFGGVYTEHFARLWDITKWEQFSELKQETDVSLASALFVPTGRKLLLKFGPGFTIHDGFTGLALLESDRAVFTGHERNLPGSRRGSPVVQSWDLAEDRILKTITPFPGFMAVSASPNAIAVASLADGDVRIYDTELEEQFSLGSGVGPAMAFHPDGSVFATANFAGLIALWSAETGERIREFRFPGRVHALKFDATGRYLVTGNANGTAYLLRLN